MSPKAFFRRISDRLLGTALDRAVRRIARHPRGGLLICWNRGLGDIALCLVPIFARIRRDAPGARIAVVTRSELADPFSMTDADDVRVIASLARDDPISAARIRADTGLEPRDFAVLFTYPDPNRWLRGRRTEFPPVLAWNAAWDECAEHLVPAAPGVTTIGAHVGSETARYYGYDKDWPAAAWRELFARFAGRTDVRWLLLGAKAEPTYTHDNVVDLRGRTTFRELVSIVRNRCRILIAPDSGVLATAYFLDTRFPLDVVSLWSDPRQGILLQGCPSPNPLLRHVPLVGRDELAANIAVDDVEREVRAALQRVVVPANASTRRFGP
jgi:hypothetical protein